MRKDAAMTVDDEPVSVDSGEAKPELRLKPGEHVIRVTRPGSQPFELATLLAAGGRTSIRPVLVPLPTIPNPTIPAPAIANPVASAAPPIPDKSCAWPFLPLPSEAPAKKLAIPTTEEQERIAKLLDEVYKVTHTRAKDKALAAQLFKTADESGTLPNERDMLLTKAVSLAADVGDYDAAFQGIDTLAASYEIDPFAAKQQLLKDSIKGVATANQITGFVAVAEQLIDQTIAKDQFDAGLALVAIAKEAISRRPSDARLFRDDDEQLARRRRQITELQKSSVATDSARKSLEKNPDDPDANLTLGRWLCLLRNDWSDGLPHYAKGSDPSLKALRSRSSRAIWTKNSRRNLPTVGGISRRKKPTSNEKTPASMPPNCIGSLCRNGNRR